MLNVLCTALRNTQRLWKYRNLNMLVIRIHIFCIGKPPCLFICVFVIVLVHRGQKLGTNLKASKKILRTGICYWNSHLEGNRILLKSLLYFYNASLECERRTAHEVVYLFRLLTIVTYTSSFLVFYNASVSEPRSKNKPSSVTVVRSR